MDIELRLLGALEVADASGELAPVRGLGARLLLALAVDRGAAVPDHDLLERLWSADPPNQAIASVRNQVARLRRTARSRSRRADQPWLPAQPRRLPGRRRRPGGHGRHGATARSAAAAELVDQALARVRGRPLDDVADEVWAMPAAAAAAELVANAEELWADAVIAARPCRRRHRRGCAGLRPPSHTENCAGGS